MRRFLSFACISLLHASSAFGATSTWTGPDSDFNTDSNWDGGVPTDIAAFDTARPQSISLSADATLNSLTFNNSAISYTLTMQNGTALSLNGAGVSNASANTQTLSNLAGQTNFNNSASAGNAAIINDGDAEQSGNTSFNNTSTAENATINNQSTGPGGFTTFNNASSAGNAKITNSGKTGAGAHTSFNDTSTAANATITNSGTQAGLGYTEFKQNSTASHAVILNTGNAYTNFLDNSTADQATITNTASLSRSAMTNFSMTSTAGNATIVNSGNGGANGGTSFTDSATAGNASIANNNYGVTTFGGSSLAGTATLTNNTSSNVGSTFNSGNTTFGNSSSADHATIINNGAQSGHGSTTFQDASTAGNATIINNSGGLTTFTGNSTAGSATLIANSGGTVDISGLSTSGLTAGSIAGAGSYILGSKSLTAGSNGVNMTVSGVISGNGGSLVKTGAGTLILSGANTYSGGTTISAGTLQGNATSLQGNILNNAVTVFDQPTDGTYAGLMSGSGSLTKIGGGILTLSGANSYTGGTTVSAGTLQGNSASLQGNILNNTSTVFDQASAGTYAGEMSGSGSLTKIGGGVLTLSGANTYLGGTTVSAGALQGNSTSLQGNILNNASVIFNQAGGGAYTSNMSGTGSLNKLGAGTLTLSGANTYTGGTTVSAGTLQGNTTSLQGNILNNASTVFNQVADGTYAGAISGTGSLTKIGAGILSFTGAHTYSGGTFVNAGTLNLTGSLAGNTTIGEGGLLTGDGSLVGLVNNGAVTPGLQGAGVLKTANYSGPGALNINFDGTTHNSLNVAGNANVSQGTLNLNGTRFTEGRYSVLSAGSLSGTFATVNKPDSAFLTFQDEYTPTDVLVDIQNNNTQFATVAQTANEMSVATALDSIKQNASPPVMQTINAIKQLAAQQARIAYNQISGDSLSYFQNLGLRSASLFTHQMNERSHPEGSIVTAGQITPIQLAYNGDFRELVQVDNPKVSNGVWGRGVGLIDHTEANASVGSPNAKATTGGFQAGYDHTVGENGLLGVSGGYANTTLNVDDRLSSGNSTARQGGIYGSYNPGPWFFNASGGYTAADNDMTRGINFSGASAQANSSFKSQMYTGFGEAGYAFKPQDKLSLEPSISLEANHVDQDAFTETGAPGFNLAVNKQKMDSLVSSLGLRLSRIFLSETTNPFRIGIRGAWLHEYRDINNLVEARFAEAPTGSFTVQGTPQKRNAVSLGVDTRITLYENLQAFANYTATLSSGETDHGILGGLSMKW